MPRSPAAPTDRGERQRLLAASGGISVGYRIADLRASNAPGGNVLVTGRAVRADGVPAPRVVLLSYRLEGTITDATGEPVSGATVVSRTLDRDFWTFRSRRTRRATTSRSSRRRTSRDPIRCRSASRSPRAVSPSPLAPRRPASNDCASATMNVASSATGTVFANPTTSAEAGAFYRGLLVGVSGPQQASSDPYSAAWPDARRGRPHARPPRARWKRLDLLRFWQSEFQTVHDGRRPGRPGQSSATWPTQRSPRVSPRHRLRPRSRPDRTTSPDFVPRVPG